MRETNLRNIPATLRALADKIEEGAYGPTSRCVIVWEADELEISYTGEGEAGPNAFILLHAGAQKLIRKD